jgi:hypothetical protein
MNLRGWASVLAVVVAALVLVGAHAPVASALPNPYFGFQSTDQYAESPSEMDAVARSGAKYWRVGFSCNRWKENPIAAFTSWNNIMRLAWERGITVLPVVGVRCNKASVELPEPSEWEPVGSPWESFLKLLVQHYGYAGEFWTGKENKKEIGAWEIWNEPNLASAGIGGSASGTYYGKFFKRSSEVLHAAQGTFFPTAALFGGMFWLEQSGGGSKTPNDFMQEAAAVTGVPFWTNGVALHPYFFANNQLTGVTQIIADARSHIDQYFGLGKGLWVTEVGWPVAPEAPADPLRPPISPEWQEQLVRGLLNWSKVNQAKYNLQSLIYYFYKDLNWNGKWDSFAGLVKEQEGEQGEYRPAWFAYQEESGVPFWSPQTAAVHGPSGNMFSWRTNGGPSDRLVGIEAGTSPSVSGLTRGGIWGRGFVVATHDNTGNLGAWTPTGGHANLLLGMEPGTNPSVASLKNGNYVVAVQANTGNLFTWTTMEAGVNRLLGMAKGTSPSVAAGPSKSYVVAIQANTGNLFTWTPTESGINRGFGMAPGTSPSVAVLASGEMLIAFQANTGVLWTWSPKAGAVNTLLGMAPGTSPSIAALPNGSYAVAIQANTGTLFTWTPSESGRDRLLGMAKGTSPSIAAMPHDGYAVAIQANTGTLFTWTTRESGKNQGVAMEAGTNPAIESGAAPFPNPTTE